MTIYRAWAVGMMSAFLLTAPFAGASAAAPGWTVDVARSRLGFSGTQTGNRFDGRFRRFDATVVFDPDHPETSRVSAVIDLSSAETGDPQRDGALPSKDWFDVAQFRQAKFVTTAVRKKGANTYEAVGNLTLHGVTHPVTLPFTLAIDGRTAHVKGHTVLLRNAYGIGQGAFATGQWVALEVGVDVDLVATRAN